MATQSKKTTKKSAVKATKPVTKKKATPTKARSSSSAKKSATKASKSSASNQPVRSFRIHESNEPFPSFSFTRETVYWMILGAVVIIFGLWITQLQSDIQAICDTIDANNRMLEE